MNCFTYSGNTCILVETKAEVKRLRCNGGIHCTLSRPVATA